MAKHWRINLEGADFSNQDLRGQDFSNANLTLANFSGANLEGANLYGAGVIRQPYSGSRRTVSFVNANLDYANLGRAWMHYGDFAGASIRNANLFDSALVGANLSGVDFSGADLRMVTFAGHDIESAANLNGATLAHAKLTDSSVTSSTSGFAELAAAQGLETVEFGDPRFLIAYLNDVFDYLHADSIEPGHVDDTGLKRDIEEQIKALVQLHSSNKPPAIIVEVLDRLTEELITQLKNEPGDLDKLPWRVFEELVAELLASFGWDVDLTAPSKDGGYDIFAVSHDGPSDRSSSWLIECKRYRRDRRVGVSHIRALYGTKMDTNVDNAMLATTSSFTRGVQEFASSHYNMSLSDYGAIVDWINDYAPHEGGKLYLRSNELILPKK